jgi:hypothetical protein
MRIALGWWLVTAVTACGGSASTPAQSDVLVGSGGASGDALSSGATQIVYVNFDGVHVEDCSNECSDARANQSWAVGAHFGGAAIDFLPYTADADSRSTVLTGLRAAYASYNVEFTTTRPEAGDYTMVIVSASGGPNHGVAPLDCGNKNPDDIAFVYRTTNSSADLVAREAAHELGHSFGLAHVASRADFMQWASSGSAFTRAPYDTVHVSGKCFDGDTQDAPALLAENLGIH